MLEFKETYTWQEVDKIKDELLRTRIQLAHTYNILNDVIPVETNKTIHWLLRQQCNGIRETLGE